MDTSEGCKGCRVTIICERYSEQGYYTMDGITYKCPCQTCLLKGICKNSCDEYLAYNKRSNKTPKVGF